VKVVLDASVAYRALDEDLLDPTMLEASEILAPDLLVSELLNARWQSVRTGAEAPTVDQIHSSSSPCFRPFPIAPKQPR
jgi:predicted nucleic acid-binding protein